MIKVSRSAERRALNAYHEAGLAVAGVALDRKFEYVTIKPEEDSLDAKLHLGFLHP